MRVISEILTDIRFAANETDTNRFPDDRLLKFINDAQDQIEAIIMIANFENSPLDKTATISAVTGTTEYSLPSDIYAWNSVSSVGFKDANSRIKKGYKYQKTTEGYYYVIGDKINFSPEITGELEIQYKAKLPRLTLVTETPSLPAMCEGFLTSFVERKIYAINSSVDISNANVFTNEEKGIITEIFSDNSDDVNEIYMERDDYGFFDEY